MAAVLWKAGLRMTHQWRSGFITITGGVDVLVVRDRVHMQETELVVTF